jgi:threonyl-tRNA synthetase
MPERFGITYVGSDGEKHKPLMIHRAIFGSLERFIGILTEHFAGKFPLWLAPVQLSILTVTQGVNDYAESLATEFREAGIRVKTDLRNEKIGYKLREARNARDSYILVVGEKEAESGSIPVRSSKEGEIGELTVTEITKKLLEEIKTKAV